MAGPTSSMDSGTPWRWYWAPCLVLAAWLLLLYGRVLGYQALNWDDQTYILGNPWLRAPLAQAWPTLLTPGALPAERLYLPLSYLLLWLEHALVGWRPAWLHGGNLLLHGLVAWLLGRLLLDLGLSRGRTWVVVALFATHPVQQETVAWIMGRRDLLAAAMGLAALLAWRRAVALPARGVAGWHGVGLLLFAGSLLCKPVLILMPLALPWLLPPPAGQGAPATGGPGWLMAQRARLRGHEGAWGLHLALALAVWWLNHLVGQGQAAPETLAASARAELLVARLGVLPELWDGWCQRLALLAPVQGLYPSGSLPGPAPLWRQALLLAIPLSLLGWALVRHRRPVATEAASEPLCWTPRLVYLGLGWGVLTGLPGVVMALGGSREFLTADRYAYLPLAGLALALVAAWPSDARRAWLHPLGVALAAGCLLLAGWQNAQTLPRWQHSTAFWDYELRHQPAYHLALGMAGSSAWDAGDATGARRYWQAAVASAPDYARGHFHLGLTASEPLAGRRHLRHALRASPDHVEATLALAELDRQAGDLGAAARGLAELLARRPNQPAVVLALAQIQRRQGQNQAAIQLLEGLVAAQPNYGPGWRLLALAREDSGQGQAAMVAYQAALALMPNDPLCLYNLGLLALARDETATAQQALRRFVEVAPRDPAASVAWVNLGFLALAAGDRPAAHAALTQARTLGLPDDPALRARVAAALAELRP